MWYWATGCVSVYTTGHTRQWLTIGVTTPGSTPGLALHLPHSHHGRIHRYISQLSQQQRTGRRPARKTALPCLAMSCRRAEPFSLAFLSRNSTANPSQARHSAFRVFKNWFYDTTEFRFDLETVPNFPLCSDITFWRQKYFRQIATLGWNYSVSNVRIRAPGERGSSSSAGLGEENYLLLIHDQFCMTEKPFFYKNLQPYWIGRLHWFAQIFSGQALMAITCLPVTCHTELKDSGDRWISIYFRIFFICKLKFMKKFTAIFLLNTFALKVARELSV